VLLLVASAARDRAPRAAAAPGRPLLDAARTLMDYLDAIRLAEPDPGRAGAAAERNGSWRTRRADRAARALALLSPEARAAVAARDGREGPHPLAPGWAASRGRLLEEFRVARVRRAPGGRAVATVVERYRSVAPDGALVSGTSDYLLAPVGGAWRIADRRPGGAFSDADLAALAAEPRGAAP